MMEKRLLSVLAIGLLWAAGAFAGTYSGGSGEPNDPYLIATAEDMNEIGAEPSDWGKHFLMTADINLADYSGEEFNVIGTGIPFTGVFDGNGHTISNFTYKETFHLPWPILHPTIDHTDQRFNTLTNINNMFSDDFIQDEPIVIPTPNDINWTPIPIPFPPSFGGDGLFASVDGVDAKIKNLTLVDPNIKTLGGSIGALVGHLHSGAVRNCGVEGGIVSKTGGIFGFGHSFIGSLVGYISDGNVSHCYVSNCDSVALFWGASAGCLTARNEAGTISNCYAIDSVVTDGALISGGLVTFNAGVILNSYVIGSENESGLVGTNIGTISNCHATGSAHWAGLVGFNEGTISNCYATGTVAGNNFAGGLVSGNKGEISNCYATAAVDGNNLIGGLVGYNDGTISNCYATGPVTGDVNVGALVGYDDGGSYVSCFWDSDVNPDLNGIGNGSDPNVIGKTTAEMQTESTFTDAGWDFTTPIWIIRDGLDYPRLWWMVIYVDNDAPNDPEPNNPDISDPNEDGSTEHPFDAIQEAIDDSSDGDIIVVDPGIYTGDGNRDLDFCGKVITVRSSDPNDPSVVAATIIDCKGRADEVHHGFYFHCGEGPDSIVAGLTITNGYHASGAGIEIHGSNATIANCIIKNNRGVGIRCGISNAIIRNCTIADNSGCGIYCSYHRTSPTIANCIISGNRAGDGGGVSYSRGPIYNCIITNNTATQGGGGGLHYCRGPITNSVIVGNIATRWGGGLKAHRGPISNCIIWQNFAPVGAQLYDSTRPIYSCIQNWTAGGIGNVNSDPCFVEPGYWDANGFWVDWDYHLLSDSPCIDAADNNSVPADITDLDGDGNTTEPIPFDLDGNPRIVDGNDDGVALVDMGAYEFVWPPIEVEMKFTPQTLNCRSKGKWVKAHFVLPEGFEVEDVDANTPAVIELFGIESDHMNVFINEDDLVEIEAAFDRAVFCSNGSLQEDIMVIAQLTTGQYFYGANTIRILVKNLEYLSVLTSSWLAADCVEPDWCGGADIDHSSTVNFVDFALFDGCCIEVVK